MSEGNLNTGTWSIRQDGAIVSEFGGFEFLGKYNITDMVVHWESLGLKHVIVSKGLFEKFVTESLKMFVSPRLYTKHGRIDYGGFVIFQEKDGGEDKAIVDPPKKTTELFFYGGKIQNPFKEPLTISPSGEMLSVIVEEGKIDELMNANPDVVFWPANVVRVFPAREIEAPEPPVVGYEIPLPIDTIEKKHELRIQALEAEIKNLYGLLNGKADKTIYGTR